MEKHQLICLNGYFGMTQKEKLDGQILTAQAAWYHRVGMSLIRTSTNSQKKFCQLTQIYILASFLKSFLIKETFLYTALGIPSGYLDYILI